MDHNSLIMIPTICTMIVLIVFMIFISSVKSEMFIKAGTNFTSYYRNLTARSDMSCALVCDKDPACRSFGYQGPNNECRLSTEHPLYQTDTSDTQWHVYNKGIQGTCQEIIESGASSKTGQYKYFDTGSDSYVDIFCDFDHHSGIGYTYFGRSTLNQLTEFDRHYIPKDHVIIRHRTLNGTQRESIIKQLPIYQPTYNVSVLHHDVYIYLNLIPLSFNDIRPYGTYAGYESNGTATSYPLCDISTFSRSFTDHIAVSTVPTSHQCYTCCSCPISTAFMDYSTLVTEPSRRMPTDFYYENYYIYLGRCGTRSVNYHTDLTDGIAIGIPFEFEMP